MGDAGECVRIGRRCINKLNGVVHHPDPDEDSARLAQQVRVDAGVFKGLVVDLKEMALLRIKRCRLPRRDLEEQVVETVEVVDHAASTGHHLALPRLVLVVEVVDDPSFWRDVLDALLAFLQD